MSEPKMIYADSEAVRVAGLVLAAELGHTVVGWGDRPAPAPNTQRITLAVLAAAYPHLRQQIETEVREEVAREVRASGVAQITFLDGDTSRLGIHRRVGAEDAYNDCYRIVTAVGAARPKENQ